MRTQGWNGPPANAVLLPDSQLTSIDNRRLLAAREVGISAQVRIRSFDEVLTPDEVTRFTRQGHPPPTTWGEAITLRIRDQNGRFGELAGNSGAYEAPRSNP